MRYPGLCSLKPKLRLHCPLPTGTWAEPDTDNGQHIVHWRMDMTVNHRFDCIKSLAKLARVRRHFANHGHPSMTHRVWDGGEPPPAESNYAVSPRPEINPLVRVWTAHRRCLCLGVE